MTFMLLFVFGLTEFKLAFSLSLTLFFGYMFAN